MRAPPPRDEEWASRATGLRIRGRSFGRGGPALLYVPSSGGDHLEFERYGMPRVCAPWIASGRLRVVAIDGLARATLWNDGLSPARRMAEYARVERAVRDEILPALADRSGGRVAVVGCSYGAFLATNLLFKRPEAIDVACGLGGVYGLWHRLGGHHDDEVYFHTPLEYVARLDDPAILGAVRGTRGLDLYAAAADEWLDSSLRLRRILADRRLPHTCEVWPAPADHHERWWRRQLARFLARRFPPG